MQVTITIKTVEQKFSGGTVGGDYRIQLAMASDPATVVDEYVGPNPSYTTDLNEGDVYALRGARLDAADNVLGPIATAQYTVGEDLVPIDVAGSISASSTPATKAAKK